jgi:PAS domain S-box-containing protein
VRKFIRTFFVPPTFDLNNKKSELARLIETTANLLLIASALYLLLFPLLEKVYQHRFYFLLPLFILLSLSKWLLRQQKLAAAAYLLVYGLWLILALDVLLIGNVFSTFYGGMLVTIIFAKLLIDRKNANILTAASILLGLFVVIMGQINPTIGFRYESALTTWLTQTLYMVVALVVLNISTSSIRRALEQAHNEIYQREITEQVLRQSENKFNMVFSSSPVAMVLSSLHQGVLDINDAFVNLIGYERSEIIGRSSRVFNLWANPEEQKETAEILIRDGEIRDFEFHFRRKDGSTGVALASAVMLDVLDESVSLATLIDISDRKTNEEKIKQLNVELEARVQERTRELEQMNEELEAFSFSVSHDLRTPLRALDSFSKILIDDYGDQFDEQALHFQRRVRENALKMTDLTNDLLALSRTSRAPLNKQTLSPASMVEEILQELSTERAHLNVSLKLNELPECLADPGLLRSVFTNLLENAIKYSQHQDPIEIEVGTIQNDEGTIFFVKDNGIGFDQKFETKIFGVFQRLHNDDHYEGSGIGLSTVQRIVRRHGGDIWAKSFPDEGATFYFTLDGSKNPEIP